MVESITYMIIYVIARVCMWLCYFNVGLKYNIVVFCSVYIDTYICFLFRNLIFQKAVCIVKNVTFKAYEVTYFKVFNVPIFHPPLLIM